MIAMVLEWVKKLTGFGGIIGGTTVIAGVLLLVGGAAAWLRDDAVRDCNAQWELTVAKRNAELEKKLGEQTVRGKELERKLAEALASAEMAMQSAQQELEKQRAEIPQTEACNACRVPNGRIWLRRDKAGGGRSNPKPIGGSS